MPRQGPRRPIVGLRESAANIAAIDARAARRKAAGDTTANRSEIVRRLIAYGLEHMPEDWTP